MITDAGPSLVDFVSYGLPLLLVIIVSWIIVFGILTFTSNRGR
jgi:hypothetical protein